MDWESFFLGLFTNAVFWAVLFFGIVPRIRFSEKILKFKWERDTHNNSGWSYRIKLENFGFRKVIDTEFFSRLEIKGLDVRNPNVTRVINVPLDPYGEKSARFPEVPPVYKTGTRRILHIYINNCPAISIYPYFPTSIKRKAKTGKLILEDLLTLGTNPSIQIIGFGYDNFSGSRKEFKSKKYYLEDIVEKDFKYRSLDVSD